VKGTFLAWLPRGRVSVLASTGVIFQSHVRDVAPDVRPGDAIVFTLVQAGPIPVARRIRRPSAPERA